ncbi:sugar phosphate isomerase/epimerase family protein [Paenibacillus sp. GCM10023252]|uniref:sugar phosphate isomerase/epimerase family protein n=1 Tax=Paenibacillus sp. GCM10023252 TaxID=3252649 RepID=UPI003621B4BB
MKLSIFTVATPELSPEELAAAAKEAGLQGIEWRYKEVPEGAEDDEPSFWGNNRSSISPYLPLSELSRYKQAAENEGLISLAVTPYVGAGDVAGTERVLQAARELGASFIRVGVPVYDGTVHFRDLYKQGRDYLEVVQPLCKEYGVKGLVETHHKTITASASGAQALVQGLDPDHIGVLFDPGNMVHEGFENYKMGIELLGPYLAHVHVKNASWITEGMNEDGSAKWQSGWAPLNEGMVPWKQVVDALRASGYDGYYGVEDFSGQYATSPAMLQNFADFMRSL